MKKYYITLAVVCTFIAASCNKEDNTEIKESTIKTESLMAVIAEEDFTKTDYAISGTKATFSWSEGDVFGRFGRASNYTYANYTAEAGIDGKNSGTFTGTAPEDALTYAFYPVSAGNGANLTIDDSANLYITLPSTIAYNQSNPLKNIVPMLGKLSSTTFEFKPIVGVIGFHASGISSTATSITLTPNSGKGMSGKSVKLTGYSLDDVGMGEDLRSNNGLARSWLANDGTGVTLTFDAGSFTEGDFYFPVATTYTKGSTDGVANPYAGLTITLKAGSDVLATVSTTSSISVNRGQIVKLPDLTFPAANVGVSLSGTSEAISAYVSSSSGTFDKVCVAALTTNSKSALDTAIPNNSSGTDITSATMGSPASISISDSGMYYIGVKAFSGTSEVFSTILASPVYFINATDKAKYVKSHTFHYGETTEAGAWKYGTIEFALSDDPTKGQLILKDVDGMTSVAANTRLAADHPLWTAMGTWLAHGDGAYAYSDDRVTDGNTYYGIINNSRLSFAANTGYEFFNYSVDGVAGHTAKIIIFSNDGKTSDAPAELAFTISADKLTLAHDYLVARWIGYFWNGSTVTNSGGWASKPLAQKDGDNRPYISLE